MKFQTTAGLLTKALATVGGVVERRSTIPILDCIKFDGRSIVGTDLDMEMTVSVPAAEAKGTACIAHRPLAGLVRHIPADDTVMITAGRDEADIAFSSGRYTLPCLPVSDFPDLVMGDQSEVDVDADQFRKALAFVSPFISTEITRYYLNGVCLDGDVAVATNGHQLGCAPLGMDCGVFSGGIIPTKGVKLITRLGASRVTVCRDKPSAFFQSAGATLRTKLIDGTFPDWRRVMPKDADVASRIVIDRADIMAAVNRLRALRGNLSSGGIGATLAWDGSHLAVTAKTYAKEGTLREFLRPISVVGNGGHACFDMHLLRTVLRSLTKDEISLSVVDEGSPAVFRDGGEAFAVLMPLRSADKGAANAALEEMREAGTVGRAA